MVSPFGYYLDKARLYCLIRDVPDVDCCTKEEVIAALEECWEDFDVIDAFEFGLIFLNLSESTPDREGLGRIYDYIRVADLGSIIGSSYDKLN